MSSIQLYIKYQDTVALARRRAIEQIEKRGENFCKNNLDSLTDEETIQFSKNTEDKHFVDLFRIQFSQYLREG